MKRYWDAPVWIALGMLACVGIAGHAQTAPAARAQTMAEVLAASRPSDWHVLDPAYTLYLELASGRVVIELAPAFAPNHVANIEVLTREKYFDGLAFLRSQDNYVVQWGDPDGDDKAKAKPLPPGLVDNGESAYLAPRFALPAAAESALSLGGDAYAGETRIIDGWPVGLDKDHAWPLHCYGMVGVGRDNPPDTGSGAELYAVIGQAPRQLDRNIALVGRVIEGIEILSSLPRGTGPIGFYTKAVERVPIVAIRNGPDVQGLPTYQMLSTHGGTFARYAAARANRRDRFFIRPAGGVDACNVPVPVRRVP